MILGVISKYFFIKLKTQYKDIKESNLEGNDSFIKIEK